MKWRRALARSARPAEPESDVTTDYRDALREVQQREGEVVRLVTTIQKAAAALERWEAAYVVGTGAGFPKEVTMAGRAIDAATWPTAQQMADTLAAWHDSAERAQNAWARLPAAARATLPTPHTGRTSDG